jgi:hypothetical protein
MSAKRPWPALSAAVLRRAIRESVEYLEGETDALWLRERAGAGWVVDVIARRAGPDVEAPRLAGADAWRNE